PNHTLNVVLTLRQNAIGTGGVKSHSPREKTGGVSSTPSMEPHMGLELTTLRSRPKVRSRVRCLTD
uniref:Uncharacterized protein n=1 Tax=Mustela putorius furo TaxID=9669 RepID=M3XMW7_MUSPF